MTELNRRFLVLLLALSMIVVLATGCGGGDEEEDPLPDISETLPEQDYYASDSLFTMNCSREAGFNPITTDNNSNYLVTQLMYDNMFDVDSSYSLSTWIISSYESDDGISWFFHVNPDVKFWDGSSLTAYDVAYSLSRAKVSSRFKERLSVVQGVSAMDDTLVLVSTYRANMQLPKMLTIPVIKDGSMEETAPMGTGPYKPDSGFTRLEAFTGNGRSHPIDTIYLKEVVGVEAGITAFESSELDIVLNDPSSFTNLGYGTANDVRSYPTTNMHFIGFNSESRYFSNELFRRAMNYIVNRDEIVTSALKGQAVPAVLPMNPACSLYNTSYAELLGYSLSKALETFDEAGVQDFDNDGLREAMVTGIPIEIDINFAVCSDSAQKVSAARIIRDSLESLGITVTLKELSRDDFLYALGSGDFDMYYSEVMLTADFDPSVLMLKDRLLNYGKFNIDGLNTAISEYLASTDDTRQKNASLMFSTIVESAPIVPVCFERHQVITHRGVVVGMKPSQFNTFFNIDEWEIQLD